MKINQVTNQKEQDLAIALHIRLAQVDITEIAIMSNLRGIARKDQAKLARQLFKSLGLKGISVTTPNYSMAQSVEIHQPKRQDYVLNDFGTIEGGCEAFNRNSEARTRLEAILLAAFPNHDNRSETQSDYFDYCWSIR